MSGNLTQLITVCLKEKQGTAVRRHVSQLKLVIWLEVVQEQSAQSWLLFTQLPAESSCHLLSEAVGLQCHAPLTYAP